MPTVIGDRTSRMLTFRTPNLSSYSAFKAQQYTATYDAKNIQNKFITKEE